jgi:hypothetical protein
MMSFMDNEHAKHTTLSTNRRVADRLVNYNSNQFCLLKVNSNRQGLMSFGLGLWVLLALLAIGCVANRPATFAHAHNDFQHTRPLREALDFGFTSIEVDVHLANDELFVAHHAEEIKPNRTLRSLYLRQSTAEAYAGRTRALRRL